MHLHLFAITHVNFFLNSLRKISLRFLHLMLKNQIRLEKMSINSFIKLLKFELNFLLTFLFTLVISQSQNNTQFNLNIWDISLGKLNISLNGHSNTVTGLAKLDNNLLASASLDNTTLIWNLTNGQLKYKLQGGHSDYVLTLMSLGNNLVATSSVDNSVIVWNVSEKIGGEIKYILPSQSNSFESTIQLNQIQLATTSMQRTICVWNLETGQLDLNLTGGHTDWILSLVKLDGRRGENRLASGSQDASVCVWNLSTGELEYKLMGHKFWVITMLSLDENFLASRSFSELIIWDVVSGLLNFTLNVGVSIAYPSMAKLRNTNLLALANCDLENSIQIWDFVTHALKYKLRGEDRSATFSVLSINDELLASGNEGSFVYIWNLTSQDMKYSLSYKANSLLTYLGDDMLVSAKGPSNSKYKKI